MQILRQAADKTKIDRVRSQQIRESCGIQSINELDGKEEREWHEHVTRMNVERLVKISKDNILVAAERSPGRWRDLIPVSTGGTTYNKKKNKFN